MSDDGIVAAYDAALASDPVSAFGSIIAVNREVSLSLSPLLSSSFLFSPTHPQITKEFVERVGKLFVEVFISTSYSAEALEWLATKKKNCRVLIAQVTFLFSSFSLYFLLFYLFIFFLQGPALAKPSLVIRSVIGGLLVQSPDVAGVDLKKWKVILCYFLFFLFFLFFLLLMFLFFIMNHYFDYFFLSHPFYLPPTGCHQETTHRRTNEDIGFCLDCLQAC